MDRNKRTLIFDYRIEVVAKKRIKNYYQTLYSFCQSTLCKMDKEKKMAITEDPLTIPLNQWKFPGKFIV